MTQGSIAMDLSDFSKVKHFFSIKPQLTLKRKYICDLFNLWTTRIIWTKKILRTYKSLNIKSLTFYRRIRRSSNKAISRTEHSNTPYLCRLIKDLKKDLRHYEHRIRLFLEETIALDKYPRNLTTFVLVIHNNDGSVNHSNKLN